ncbi:hypothetical protein ANCCEY_11353 [Ancylostoma ceylanicum]|uniref:Uncharacterized protein n=1 Tax=Ancylostoma ceylanicum TaxID=53326 RepID=A0A0D6LCF1_9BILA|nr:hypothetical protein ANCCEY_11353 [Ancylostoma ceylanicum]
MHLIEIRYLYGSTTRMAGRRQSMTAQISRQARRLSAVIVPQFTKIEPVNILQKVEGVEIRLNDMAQNAEKVKHQWLMHQFCGTTGLV